jgi:hypothetical protein
MLQMAPKTPKRRVLGTFATVLCTVGTIAACNHAFAQSCKPVSQRTGAEKGCWIVSAEPLGQLPRGPLFWHLDTYPMRAAAEAAKGPHGAVVESLGRIWLFTIAEREWRPVGGARVAEIGPLAVDPNTKYTASYRESIQTPGNPIGSSHRHPGPEASYTESGETCFETPEGKIVGRAGGEHVVVPGGHPMFFAATGSETRRALGLILHDSTKPVSSQAPDWTPTGLCNS